MWMSVYCQMFAILLRIARTFLDPINARARLVLKAMGNFAKNIKASTVQWSAI